MNRLKRTVSIFVSLMVIVAMMPVAGAVQNQGSGGEPLTGGSATGESLADGSDASAYVAFAAEAESPVQAAGGTVYVGTDDEAIESAEAAIGEYNGLTASGDTLTIELYRDTVLSAPIRFVLGGNSSIGKKVVVDLNGHTLAGRAGEVSDNRSTSQGGNAIEIAADEFNVEIKGPGSVIGGKGAQYTGDDIRYGSMGGCAVYFCERVDKLHGITEEVGDMIITDEGYRPDKLEFGLTVTGGAVLKGGDGADATYDDWVSNVNGECGDVRFLAIAGNGGNGIGQVFTGTAKETSLEELSYAKIIIEDGTVQGGSGGNADIGDNLFTRYDVQKMSAVRNYLAGEDSSYNFDDYLMDAISFNNGDGGHGIEFHAGRKYIAVESNGAVYGGSGGRTLCTDRAAMVKKIQTACGYGGNGIYVCGDTGLTNEAVSLSDNSGDPGYWAGKSRTSDDVGIYVAGLVKGGSSPETIILNDATGNGGTGIECEMDGNFYLCESYQGAAFDADRGIVLVDAGGQVFGGDGGSPGKTTISGGNGGDAITGGATGSPASSTPKMAAGWFIIRGEAVGGYGSRIGGSGISLYHEKEYLDSTNSSAYFAGMILGDGTVSGGDSGVWPYVEDKSGYTANSSDVICKDGEPVAAEGIPYKYEHHTANEYHDASMTISPEIREGFGASPTVMPSDKNFKVSPNMTPFTGAPDSKTKLSASVSVPSGYKGKVYLVWQAEVETADPRSFVDIEGANGGYNNFALLGDKDYPYGISKKDYGSFILYDNNLDVATYDIMAERIKYNDNNKVTIFCYAILEDGRFAESELWFTKNRRSENGWGNGGSDSADQAAADAVTAKINSISDDPEAIGLFDEEEIVAIRQAYDALTSAQKSLVSQEALARLEAAEARILELNQAEADSAAESINALLADMPDIASLDPDDPGYADKAAAIKQAVEGAVAAYNALSDSQKRLVDVSVRAKLDNAVTDYNSAFPDDAVDEPADPGEVKIQISNCKIKIASATYTGKARKPAVTVTFGDFTLVKGRDFEVTYSSNVKAGKSAKAVIKGIGDYTGTVTKSFTIGKAANPLSVKAKTATVKTKKLKKKAQTLAVTKVMTFKKNGKGTMKYTLSSAKKGSKNFKKYFKINAKTGKVTIKKNKKMKKGTYTVKVKVKAAGDSNYKASATKTVTFKIKVK